MPGYVLGNFSVYSVINAFTPGPGNILALNTVTNYGYKKGKPLFWGIFAGYYVVRIICAVFVFGEYLSAECAWATTGTVATLTWVGMGVLIQRAYQKHYRVVNMIPALTLSECVYNMLK